MSLSSVEILPIQHPLVLTGYGVTLLPLETAHFDRICSLGRHPDIWTYSPTGVNGMNQDNALAFLQRCLVRREAGEWYPFIITRKDDGEMMGFTMFHSISYAHKSLEIGASWLHPDYWGAGVNTACKYLLLQYCFEPLGLMRVQIKSSHDNERSRNAIEKIGAVFEGILRKDRVYWKMVRSGMLRITALLTMNGQG